MAKHQAFSTNHLADIDKTKYNDNQQQQIPEQSCK